MMGVRIPPGALSDCVAKTTDALDIIRWRLKRRIHLASNQVPNIRSAIKELYTS